MIDFTSRRMKIDLSYPKDKLMSCPFCGMGHPMYINGTTYDYHTGEVKVHPNKGYSFCNCKNIWYTDWENNKQDKHKREEISERIKKAQENNIALRFKRVVRGLTNLKPKIKSFLQIGCGRLLLEDLIREHLGWKTTSVDINKNLNPNGHKLIYGDIEDIKVLSKLKKYDVIWASHVIEHLHYPLKTISKLKEHLTEGGLLVVFMPDPFFINFNNPLEFGMWMLHHHHIIWDLLSFTEELKKLGFIVKMSKHEPSYLAKEFMVIASNPTKKEKMFKKLIEKGKTEIPIDLINPNDAGHDIENIDKEHREGAEKVKELIKKGKRIRPIAVTSYGKRLDGFKRYVAFKELGYKTIPIEIHSRGGCQHGEDWVIDG